MEEKQNNYKAWFYLLPVLFLVGIFILFPVIQTIVTSFLKDYNSSISTSSGFTFDNYAYILGVKPRIEGGSLNQDFVSLSRPSALMNTLFLVIITVPISVILALIISIALNSIKVVRGFFQTIFFMPYVTNVIAVGLVFSVIFAPTGVYNRIFNLSTNWLGSNTNWGRAMFVLCLYIIWNGLPYKILIFSSGLQGINKQYYDAAKVDGMSALKTHAKITVPLLSPQILYIFVTSFISGFKEYDSLVGLFGPGRNYTSDGNLRDLYTVVYYIYDIVDGRNRLGIQYACAAAVILFVIILLVTLVQFRIGKKRVVY